MYQVHGLHASQEIRAGNRKTSTEIITSWDTCYEVMKGESCRVEGFALDRAAGVWE